MNTTKLTVRERSTSDGRHAAALLSLAGIAGCVSGELSSDALDDATAEATIALQAQSADKLEVRAIGTGCPEGSWSARITDEGATIDVTFQDYTAIVSDLRTQETRACTVSVRLGDHPDAVYFPEVVVVDASRNGGTVKYTQETRWTGSAAPSDVSGWESNGYWDWSQAYHLTALRSACTGPQELRIETSLQNTRPRSDEPAVRTVDGTITARVRNIRVRLGTAPCGDVAGTATLPPVAPAGDPEVTVTQAAPRGKDCSDRTTRLTTSGEGRGFRAAFEALATEGSDGFGVPALCELDLALSAPAGRSYALASYTARGEASLPKGVRGELWLTPTYAGSFVDPESRRFSQVRAEGQTFTVSERVRDSQLKFSPCGASLPNLRLSLALNLASEQPEQALPGGTLRLTELSDLTFVSRPCPVDAAPR